MAKKIGRAKVRRSQELPTTGNGTTGGQKPKYGETNGVPRFGGFVAKLFTFRTEPGKGKHHR